MRWLLMVMFLLSPLCLVMAQPPATGIPPAGQVTDPLQLIEDARALFVARELKLRQDQVQKILPLLNQAQQLLEQRKQTLDALWAKGEATITAVDQALIAGQQPTRVAQNAVEALVSDHSRANQETDKGLEQLAGQMIGLLDRQQAARLERPAARDNRQEQTVDLLEHIGGYVMAMRELAPEEYDTLRVPVALRLAGELVKPDAPAFNNTVGSMLRLMDAVKQRTDAQFADDRQHMGQIVARALGLPEERAPAAFVVSLADVMAFVSNPRTAQLLAQFKPEPAMEVVP